MNFKKELIDKIKKLSDKDASNLYHRMKELIDDYLSIDSMSECERQPVSNNEQLQEYCQQCGSENILGNGSDTNICDDCGHEWQYG